MKVTPFGSVQDSVSCGAGDPVVVAMNEPAPPTWNGPYAFANPVCFSWISASRFFQSFLTSQPCRCVRAPMTGSQ